MSKNNRKQDIQKEIENILRNNSLRSYSKEEIINLMSSDNSTQKEIEMTLGEMQGWHRILSMGTGAIKAFESVDPILWNKNLQIKIARIFLNNRCEFMNLLD
jgi:hypothetical protein